MQKAKQFLTAILLLSFMASSFTSCLVSRTRRIERRDYRRSHHQHHDRSYDRGRY